MLWVLIGAGALLLLLGFCFFGIGRYAFREVCLREPGDPSTPESLANSVHKAYADKILAGQAWAAAHGAERVETRSFDGLRLVARLIQKENARGVAILFHGYRSAWNIDFACAFSTYYDLGFSLLVVDERAHGESEGRNLTFGVRERRDVLTWINYVNQRFGEQTPILLAGLSMGSATVQMACGLDLPQNVRAVVADCGYTSPYEIVRHVFRDWHKPLWLLPPLQLYCRLFGGFGMKEYSTLTAQRHNHIPTFFAHGGDDDFVPCEMTQRNYEACAAPKKLFTVPTAGHGKSFLVDREGYIREVTAFLDQYI